MSLATETELDAPPDSVRPDPSHLAPRTSDLPLTIIEPRRGWRSLELAELWRYRHLLYMFMWRNIKASQKQTVLGILWIFIGPLASVAMMTVVFSRMLNVPSDGFPYPIFLFAGNFLWGQFSGATGGSMNSVVGSANFIQKVYFPRLLIPLSAATGGLINVCIVFPLILVVMVVLGYPPLWTTVFCPLIILMALATGLGIGLWLAPLNVVRKSCPIFSWGVRRAINASTGSADSLCTAIGGATNVSAIRRRISLCAKCLDFMRRMIRETVPGDKWLVERSSAPRGTPSGDEVPRL